MVEFGVSPRGPRRCSGGSSDIWGDRQERQIESPHETTAGKGFEGSTWYEWGEEGQEATRDGTTGAIEYKSTLRLTEERTSGSRGTIKRPGGVLERI